MKSANILILARRSEQVENLGFLLRLSLCRTLRIADGTEAFNCLVQRQSSPQPFDLLLIVDADNHQPFLPLLGELERRQVPLPIILIARDREIDLAELPCSRQVRDRIRQCARTEIHTSLREILNYLTYSDSAIKPHHCTKGVLHAP